MAMWHLRDLRPRTLQASRVAGGLPPGRSRMVLEDICFMVRINMVKMVISMEKWLIHGDFMEFEGCNVRNPGCNQQLP